MKQPINISITIDLDGNINVDGNVNPHITLHVIQQAGLICIEEIMKTEADRNKQAVTAIESETAE